MKRITFFFIIACLSVIKAAAFEWTDESGVKWSFWQNSYTINNVSQYYWTIEGASGYSDEVTIPDMVYVTNPSGMEAHNVEAVSLYLDANASTVTLPTNLKYLYRLEMNSGIVKLDASTPPIYGSTSNNVVFKVPAKALDAYRTADGWKDIADRIISQDAKTEYTITTTAKPESSGIHEKIGEEYLNNVMSLKVSGTINSYDLMIIRNKMHNLKHLDLTDANIVANSFQYYSGYCTEDNILGGYAFYSFQTLQTVKLPKTITSIGVSAFYNCDALKSVEIQSGVKTIGMFAFSDCGALKSIKLPEGLTSIENSTFSWCNGLESVELPSTLESIGSDAFYYCRRLATVNLPSRLKTIGYEAFGSTSLKEIHIPSSVTSIGESTFNINELKDVYAYTIEPIQISQNTFSAWNTATLHVPSFSYNRYYWNTQWSQFSKIVEFEGTFPYDYFYANNDLCFDDETGIMDGTPDADLNMGAGLIVETTKSKLHLGKVTMSETGSIIANDNLTVDELHMNMEISGFQWYFISLPYRVKISNITAPGNYVIRYYDGSERASRGGGGWKDYTGTYLQPKQGYIIQCDNYGTLTMLVEKADMDFSGGTRQDALTNYASSSAQNASWNFLGNPHSSYFDIDDTGYDAPITIWNGSSYQAVRAGDDQYHLAPMQGFFVQKPEGKNEISFPASGRHTYNQWADRVAAKEKSASRSRGNDNVIRHIVNLTICSGGTIADQARVVYNNVKSADYEMDCDAAKFLSDQSAAQLYTLGQDGTQYAINERPLGDVCLSYMAKQQGELTISAPRMDCPVWLYDKVMNITHDLSLGGYTFATEAGAYEGRFTLMTGNSATSIVNVEKLSDKETTNNYTLSGIRTSEEGRGIIIKKSGNNTIKVIKK